MATTLANGSTSKPIDTVSAVTGSSSANPIESDPATTQSWIGAFLILLPIVPIIATIVCIATYL